VRFARTGTTTGEPSAIVLALKAGQFVSKIKTLQDKKRLSYEHDRRNTYGENQKSSRKNIPRSKQLSHQDERRSVRQALIAAQGDITEDVADEAQSQALQKGRIKKLNAFRKSADRPLGKSSSVDCAGRRAEIIIIRKRIGAGEGNRTLVFSLEGFRRLNTFNARSDKSPQNPSSGTNGFYALSEHRGRS